MAQKEATEQFSQPRCSPSEPGTWTHMLAKLEVPLRTRGRQKSFSMVLETKSFKCHEGVK